MGIIFKSVNPYNQQIVGTYETESIAAMQKKIADSHLTYLSWKKRTVSQRALTLMKLVEALEAEKASLADLMTDEMGKLTGEATGEIEKCQWLIRYYCKNAPDFLANKYINAGYKNSYVSYQPLGVCIGIMPWNFPFWQIMRFAIPTLLAGNTVVIKHAPSVSGCALALEKLFESLDVPDIYTNIIATIEDMKQVLVIPAIKGVSLTGSTRAGKAVANLASDQLKKCVFELGGSDPYLILADADIKKAIEACTIARLLNAGQSCIAGKRFIVDKSIEDEFTQALKTSFSKYKMGDPKHPETTLAPLAQLSFRDHLHQQVLTSLAKGATLELGGYVPESSGAFYPPTILSKVSEGMPAYNEEIFGPVASIIEFETVEEAIHIANDTSFGLGAAIFSADIGKAEAIAANELNAGCVFINDFVRSDPRLPFGGINQSGYGRELSEYGIHEFCNIKTVVLS